MKNCSISKKSSDFTLPRKKKMKVIFVYIISVLLMGYSIVEQLSLKILRGIGHFLIKM